MQGLGRVLVEGHVRASMCRKGAEVLEGGEEQERGC